MPTTHDRQLPSLAELTALPALSVDLLDILERSFPLQNPDVNATLAEIQREAGRQELIHLLRLLKARGDEALVSA